MKKILATIPKLTRRALLKTSSALAVSTLLFPLHSKGAVKQFSLGVASGDPLADRVILWTKVSLDNKKQKKVSWQMATDRKFKNIVKTGKEKALAKNDGIIKFDCKDLKPATIYFYRFIAGDEVSMIGRTKTLPTGRLDSLKLGVVSCSNYNAGFFTAYRGLAEIDDLDAVIHLGDYIYEYGNYQYGNNKLRSLKPRGEVLTLTDYRTRYAHYRSDVDLQKLHAAHPMIAVWDDHEIANNGWRYGAQNHSPNKEGKYSERQLAARQAYFEYLPIRPRKNNGIYRRFAFGDLATLIMIDSRYDGRQKELRLEGFIKTDKNKKSYFDKTAFDKKVFNPYRKIMSRAQSLWIKNSLFWASRNTSWTIIGNQVPFEPTYYGQVKADKNSLKIIQQIADRLDLARKAGLKKIPVSLDEWSGFPANQQNLVRDIKKANNTTLVLTGDTHNGWATYYGNKDGIELGTPGVSSPGIEAYISKKLLESTKKSFLKANPNSIFRDMTHRGFMVLEVGRNQAKAKWVWANVKTRRGKLTQGPELSMPRANLKKAKYKT